METIINGVALLLLLIGGGIFIVNAPGGSGFDIATPFSRTKLDARRTPKIIPRFRYGMIVGGMIFLAGVGIMFWA